MAKAGFKDGNTIDLLKIWFPYIILDNGIARVNHPGGSHAID